MCRKDIEVASQDPASALVSAYLVAGEGGRVSPKGRRHLQHLWDLLDPSRTLSLQVQDQLNGVFEAEWQRLVSNRIDGWFWRQVCLPFEVDEQDLEEALQDLNPPRKELVRLFGLDLGLVVGTISPLGLGGVTRARFQLVALSNFFGRARHGEPSTACALQRCTSLPPREKSGVHPHMLRAYILESWTLYATIVAARYVPLLLKLFNLRAITKMLQRMVREPLAALRLLGQVALATVVTRRLDLYRKIMLHRIPMLTARLHRRLRVKGYISYEGE